MTKCVSKWFLPFSYPFFFFNLANEWMSVICPHRKGKRCWLSEYKLDTPMSSLAKDELSVSMVTRSSLSYGYPLTSLWSYFLLYSRPYRHTRASARRRHTLPNTHRFSFHPPCPCCFFYHILSSPTLLHSPWLFLRLKTIPCPLSTRIAFYMSPAPLFLSFFDSHAAHYINRAQAFCGTPPDSVFLLIFQQVDSGCTHVKLLSFFYYFFYSSVSSLKAKVAGTHRRRCSKNIFHKVYLNPWV